MLLSNLKTPNFTSTAPKWQTGAIAGLAGGAAEISWITIYTYISGGEAAIVARGVTQTLFPQLISPSAVPVGIAVHMGLAIILGIAIAIFVRSVLPRTTPAALEAFAVVGLLVGVWGLNFFVILPVINPAFVTLVPYAASLISKILFGAVAALVFRLLDGPRPVAEQI
jgi:hypothetical protein